MIPISFTRKHFGEEDYASSPTALTLRTPNGLTWDVEILKTPCRLRTNNQPEFWIQGNAWEQFILPDSDARPSSGSEREEEAEQFEDVDDEDEVSVEDDQYDGDDDSVEILTDSESGPCSCSLPVLISLFVCLVASDTVVLSCIS
ncbi:hypothetical protein LINPERHAP1_LOCUS8242 [Linum perenne]